MEKEEGDGGYIEGYFIHDSYNNALIYISVSNLYYGSANNEETNIKINFKNSDNRFEYGAYLILSNYLK